MTTFVSGTTITADWLNKTDTALRTAIGDGMNMPTNAAQVLANLGISSATISTTRAETGAVSRTVASKLNDIVNAVDFGVSTASSGSANTLALQNALNAAAGKTLVINPGIYQIGVGAALTVSADTTIYGYGAILQIASNPANMSILIDSADHVQIAGLKIDYQGFGIATDSMIAVRHSDFFKIIDCSFYRFKYFGLSLGSCSNAYICDNYFEKDTPTGTYTNMAINVFVIDTVCQYNRIERNSINGAPINVTMTHSSISNNMIYSWKYGGGITTEQNSTYSNHLIISNNLCFYSLGTDKDFTNPPGIENWAPYSTITNNTIAYCSGSGIDSGGAHSVISGNLCLNNGTTGGSGITSRTGTYPYCADYTVVSSNSCLDTSGGSGTQSYGYEEVSTSLNGIQVVGNCFRGNKLGPQRVQAYTTNFQGPSMAYSQSYGSTIVTLAAGASSVITQSLIGARQGDFVQVSYSGSLNGLVLTAYCHTNDSITISFYNPTSGSVSLGAGTLYGKATKTQWSADI